MTRIIAGRSKGRRLRSPKGQGTRPTGARVRQTLFDILAPELPECRFLDAFAGSGGVGLEALSRGAACVVLVDRRTPAVAAIRDNVKTFEAGGDVRIYQQEAGVALGALAEAGERYDVVFLDPPYGRGLAFRAVERLATWPGFGEDTLGITKTFKKERFAGPAPLSLLGVRRVGDDDLSFFNKIRSSRATSRRGEVT